MTSYLEKYPLSRLRRNRQSKWIRNLVSENKLTSDDLIWPIFLCEGNNVKEEIIFKNEIGRIRDIKIHPDNGKIFFLAQDKLWLFEKK